MLQRAKRQATHGAEQITGKAPVNSETASMEDSENWPPPALCSRAMEHFCGYMAGNAGSSAAYAHSKDGTPHAAERAEDKGHAFVNVLALMLSDDTNLPALEQDALLLLLADKHRHSSDLSERAALLLSKLRQLHPITRLSGSKVEQDPYAWTLTEHQRQRWGMSERAAGASESLAPLMGGTHGFELLLRCVTAAHTLLTRVAGGGASGSAAGTGQAGHGATPRKRTAAAAAAAGTSAAVVARGQSPSPLGMPSATPSTPQRSAQVPDPHAARGVSPMDLDLSLDPSQSQGTPVLLESPQGAAGASAGASAGKVPGAGGPSGGPGGAVMRACSEEEGGVMVLEYLVDTMAQDLDVRLVHAHQLDFGPAALGPLQSSIAFGMLYDRNAGSGDWHDKHPSHGKSLLFHMLLDMVTTSQAALAAGVAPTAHAGVGSAARLGALACALFNVMLDATAAAERVGAYDRTRKTMIAKTNDHVQLLRRLERELTRMDSSTAWQGLLSALQPAAASRLLALHVGVRYSEDMTSKLPDHAGLPQHSFLGPLTEYHVVHDGAAGMPVQVSPESLLKLLRDQWPWAVRRLHIKMQGSSGACALTAMAAIHSARALRMQAALDRMQAGAAASSGVGDGSIGIGLGIGGTRAWGAAGSGACVVRSAAHTPLVAPSCTAALRDVYQGIVEQTQQGASEGGSGHDLMTQLLIKMAHREVQQL